MFIHTIYVHPSPHSRYDDAMAKSTVCLLHPENPSPQGKDGSKSVRRCGMKHHPLGTGGGMEGLDGDFVRVFNKG